MRELTDKQLLIKIKDGNRSAMESFYHRYSPYLYAVCIRYITDRATAADLLHDAFIKIFTSIHTFRFTDMQSDADISHSLKSWTARITANLALNYIRDNSHIQFISFDEEAYSDIPDTEIDAQLLSVETIYKLIESLPTNYRTVFNLFAIEGFSHREISKMLGISENVSSTQYFRAKAALKVKIKHYLEHTR